MRIFASPLYVWMSQTCRLDGNLSYRNMDGLWHSLFSRFGALVPAAHEPSLLLPSPNVFDSVPIPSMWISIVLPGFIGSAPNEVAQVMRSPGRSVIPREIRCTSSSGEKNMSFTG